MNRRTFLRAATGCAVAAPLARHAVVMVPPQFGMSERVWLTEEAIEQLKEAGLLGALGKLHYIDYRTRMYLISWIWDTK